MPPTVQIYFEVKVRPDRSRAGICLWRTIGHLVRAINCHERGIPSGRFGQHFQRNWSNSPAHAARLNYAGRFPETGVPAMRARIER